jgi:hypothetical protein
MGRRFSAATQQQRNAAREALHHDPAVRAKENATRRQQQLEHRNDPAVRAQENAAREALHHDPAVRAKENAAWEAL